MCLITDQLTAKIATEDIVVFKALKKVNKESARSYMSSTGFTYTLGETYRTEIKDSCDWTPLDERNRNFLNRHHPKWYSENTNVLKCIGQGFHAAKTPNRMKGFDGSNGESIYQGTIPAGSEYFEDGDGLIVSNSICINRLTQYNKGRIK